MWSDVRQLVVKGAIVVTTVVAAAAVLWLRQTPDALLGADSFADAVMTVFYGAVPALVLYLAVPLTRPAAYVEGAFLGAVLVWTWWVSATDGNSTAGVGPFVMGWLLAPTVIGIGAVADRFRAGTR